LLIPSVWTALAKLNMKSFLDCPLKNKERAGAILNLGELHNQDSVFCSGESLLKPYPWKSRQPRCINPNETQ
jgi:hypothetical protein